MTTWKYIYDVRWEARNRRDAGKAYVRADSQRQAISRAKSVLGAPAVELRGLKYFSAVRAGRNVPALNKNVW